MDIAEAERILELDAGYAPADVDAAYRSLVRQMHPDAAAANGIDADVAANAMTSINIAYRMLKNAMSPSSSAAPSANRRRQAPSGRQEGGTYIPRWKRDAGRGKVYTEEEKARNRAEWEARRERFRREGFDIGGMFGGSGTAAPDAASPGAPPEMSGQADEEGGATGYDELVERTSKKMATIAEDAAHYKMRAAAFKSKSRDDEDIARAADEVSRLADAARKAAEACSAACSDRLSDESISHLAGEAEAAIGNAAVELIRLQRAAQGDRLRGTGGSELRREKLAEMNEARKRAENPMYDWPAGWKLLWGICGQAWLFRLLALACSLLPFILLGGVEPVLRLMAANTAAGIGAFVLAGAGIVNLVTGGVTDRVLLAARRAIAGYFGLEEIGRK